jgi:RNA polymerase sigma-70 factor (ECF subfamily)
MTPQTDPAEPEPEITHEATDETAAEQDEAPSRLLDVTTIGTYVERLFRAAVAMCGSALLAEDLVQETYVRVLSRPRYLRSTNELGYLLQVLRNVYITHLRGEARGPRTVELLDVGQPRFDLDDTTEAEAALVMQELYAEIAGLPAGFRDVVLAVDIAGLSYEETAQVLQIRIGTVMSRLFRGRNRIAEQLSADAYQVP